jgi:hypothetical protein
MDASGERPGLVNVVIISQDPNRDDNYGRQTERFTSIVHESYQNPPVGNYWKE